MLDATPLARTERATERRKNRKTIFSARSKRNSRPTGLPPPPPSLPPLSAPLDEEDEMVAWKCRPLAPPIRPPPQHDRRLRLDRTRAMIASTLAPRLGGEKTQKMCPVSDRAWLRKKIRPAERSTTATPTKGTKSLPSSLLPALTVD